MTGSFKKQKMLPQPMAILMIFRKTLRDYLILGNRENRSTGKEEVQRILKG